MTSPDGKPRRWLQFSLRTLFVVMLVVAAFFGGRESMRPVIEAERIKATELGKLAEVERAERIRAVEETLSYKMTALMMEQKLRLRESTYSRPRDKMP